MKSSLCEGKGPWGNIRILAVNWKPILAWSKDEETTLAETAPDEYITEAVRPLCEFSPLVSQQNHTNGTLTALHDTQKWLYKKNGAFRAQQMLKPAKAQLNEQFARESHQLWGQQILKICAAMEVDVYRIEMITIPKLRQSQVLLNGACQLAKTWSQADWQRATERFEREIH